MAVLPREIRKRDGTLVAFDPEQIRRAIDRAAAEAGVRDPGVIGKAARRVVDRVAARFDGRAPTVEQVQDAVEDTLMTAGLADVARAYLLYRSRRAELRDSKRMLGVRDELKLTLAATVVLRERYLRRDETGAVVESTGEMMDRVAGHVARAEEEFLPGASAHWAGEFGRAMRALEFLPNSPTLVNAGTELGLLSGCFVLPVEDSLDSIFTAVKDAVLIQQGGGGTGFAFSHLRPAGDPVRSTHGVASGPVPFMRVFDVATQVVRQGGRRRGANMAVLDCAHPDIRAFAAAKAHSEHFENFNLSVAAPDAFLHAVQDRASWPLVNPRTGETAGEVDAAELFDLIAAQAWRTGDPGLLFTDRINRANPVPSLGRIEAANPCGEVPLLPYESCNLGSLNLPRFVSGGTVDWPRLTGAVRLAVRFLDDVIEVNRFPFGELEEAARRTRKIGLGFMGLAELLAMLGVPYGSAEAVRLAGRIAHRIAAAAREASAELAAERGPFPCFGQSVHAGGPPLRNAQLTAVAPTGTISLIAGTTSGIEPMFALAYVRNVLGRHLIEVDPLFERTARDRGFWSEHLMADIAATGSLPDHPSVPADVRHAFVTAAQVPPEAHLAMQAAVQRHIDAGVSKTVNLPASATVDEVKRIYLEAWRAGVKGITVYRYGSKPGQVLTYLAEPPRQAPVQVDGAYAGGCAHHVCEY
ncbi:adenosylcobalamin-dependent ribonucleoside-diphosphate reductase [Actinomadura formosensis]|uniref:adenosylcobalamin-dependent ribonucleoside-diphosphate reductase n=1 Tax=Actinomadura formosensis TaxID=60706 RepID=UPI00157D0D1F|nr:adenosylcobalamin-dependent ribonucleoside-diphosphate reductase [Actinomadura formosensis]